MSKKTHKNNEIRQSIAPTPKGQKRTHAVMKETYGVNRPGKTAADKANGHVPYRKNRRMPDGKK